MKLIFLLFILIPTAALATSRKDLTEIIGISSGAAKRSFGGAFFLSIVLSTAFVTPVHCFAELPKAYVSPHQEPRITSSADFGPTEREKWEKENGLKERELRVKEGELELKRKNDYGSSWQNPLVVAIMAAAAAAFGNAFVSMTNGKLQRRLEDQKSEQLRIQEMIKTGDPDKAAENLRFLLDAGLINTPDVAQKLQLFLAHRTQGSGPTLPSAALLDEKSLARRINAIKRIQRPTRPNGNQPYGVEEGILLDSFGDPVSVVETPSKGNYIKELKAIVVHYSSAATKTSLNAFSNKSMKSSTHLLIDPDGKVTQLVPFDIAAWHAGVSSWNGLDGLNNYSIGITFVNAGRLEMKEGNWKSWMGTTFSDSDVFLEDSSDGTKVGWQRYTETQIASGEQVIYVLAAAYPSIEAVLRHSEIRAGKLDPGPAFPLERMQAALNKARSCVSGGGVCP